MKAKKYIVYAAVAVTILVVIAVVVVVLAGSKPSKKDYQSAQAQTTKITSGFKNLDSSFTTYINGYFAGKTTDKSMYTKDLVAYQAQLAKLSKLKAIQKDSAVNKAYQAFYVQDQKTLNYIEGYVNDAAAYKDLSNSSCTKLENFDNDNPATLVADYDAAVKSCSSDLRTLSSSKNQVYALYAKNLSAFLVSRRPVYVNTVTAYNSGDATKEQQSLQALANNKPTDITANINQIRSSISSQKQLEALQRALKAKS